jgi:hypothetical protein
MCPACLATISIMVAGVISTGGMAALAVKTIGRGNGSGEASGAGVFRGEQNLQNLDTKEKQQ